MNGSSQFHHAVDGNIMGWKERFVARGIDYEETFAATRNTHDRKNHVCKWKKSLYELRRNPYDNTYMRSLMKILNFARRLKMKIL